MNFSDFDDDLAPNRPMSFEPAWYRAVKADSAACDCSQERDQCPTPEACRWPEDDFGAVGAFAELWPALAVAWALIAATAAFFWLVMP